MPPAHSPSLPACFRFTVWQFCQICLLQKEDYCLVAVRLYCYSRVVLRPYGLLLRLVLRFKAQIIGKQADASACVNFAFDNDEHFDTTVGQF